MRIGRRALYEALKNLSRVAPTKFAVEVLTGVLIAAKNGIAELTATDLETRLVYRLPAEGELSACLPVKLLRDLVKPESARQAGEVVIEPVSEQQVMVNAGGAESRLNCFVPSQFPDWPVAPGDFRPCVIWDGGRLRDALEFVLPAVSRDPSRPGLRGVYFDAGRIVSTDGHRLHWHALEPKLPKQLLLPGAAAGVLMQLTGDDSVALARAEGWVRIEGGNWSLAAKEMDTTYPQYTRVVPGQNEATSVILLPTALARREVQRLKRVAPKANIKVRLNGALTLAVQDYDNNQAEAVIQPLENSHKGEDLVTGLDPAYLLDALGKADETARVGFGSSAADPVRIDLAGGRMAVVMPVRL